MKYTLSGRLWKEGCELVNSNKVKKQKQTTQADGTQLLQASVDSAFGFVHHPGAIYDAGQKTILAYTCDCWKIAEGGFCEHCAALIANAEACGDGNIQIDAYPDANRRLAQKITAKKAASKSDEKTYSGLTVKEDHILSSGNREVTGRMACAFGFYHYPVLVLDKEKIIDYHCDCFKIAENPGLCPHCAALFDYISEENVEKEQEDESEEDTVKDEGTEEKPEKDTVENKKTGEDGTETDEDSADETVTPETPEKTEDSDREDSSDANDTDHIGENDDTENTDDRSNTDTENQEDDTSEETVEDDGDEEEDDDSDTSTDPGLEGEEFHEPCSMKILLGHNPKDNSSVHWYPNDTEQLVHVNTGIIGTMGTGKTQFTKSLITQLFRQQYNNFDGRPLSMLIFDYKGDYNLSKEDFVRATRAKVLGLHNLPFNPMSLRGLKVKPQLPYHVASAFANILTKIYHLGPVQNNLLLDSIIRAYNRRGITSDPDTWNRPAPTFEDVYQIYQEGTPKQDALYSAMYALHQFEIFEKDPAKTQSLFAMLDGVTVLDLSGYDSRIQNLTVAITLELFCSQMLGSGSSRSNAKYRQLTRLILVDEADNIMSEGFPALKTIMKEGREFGVGTILSTQSLKHFGIGEEDYASYILTWVVHAVPDLKKSDVEYLLKTAPGQAEQLSQEIARLPKHHSIARVGNTDPVFMEDTPFWKIADDIMQTYLEEEESVEENEDESKKEGDSEEKQNE